MTIAHKNLTGVDLHEPKGVAAATSGQVYRADGAGSGSWQTLTIPTGLFRVALTSFTSSGTWTKPAGLFKVRVHVVGEGGTASLSGVGGSAFGGHVGATGGTPTTPGSGVVGDIILTGTLDGIGAGPWSPKGNGIDGAGGGYAVKEILDVSLASTVVVGISASAAANGFVVVEEYISV